MNLKEIKSERTSDKYYTTKLDNGLKIFIVPNDRVEDIFVTYTVKYGGCNFPFLIDKKMQKLPSGIAHFLEHKMFEQKNRIEPFTFYSKTGTYCNASTNYYNTSYVFAGNNNFEENLNENILDIKKEEDNFFF